MPRSRAGHARARISWHWTVVAVIETPFRLVLHLCVLSENQYLGIPKNAAAVMDYNSCRAARQWGAGVADHVWSLRKAVLESDYLLGGLP
jgi:hypothetical protein